MSGAILVRDRREAPVAVAMPPQARLAPPAIGGAARPARRDPASRDNFLVALIAAACFLLVAAVLRRNGYVSPDFDAMLNAGAGRQSGGWLSETMLFGVRAQPTAWLQQTLLALLPAAGTGLVFGVLYHNVRDSDWRAGAATLLLALLGGHALVLFAITSVGLTLPIFIAAAALIPAIRRLESVGDVQADINFGLALPLLLLAGPATSLLIVPLAIASAFAHPDGRSDRRAFVAMLLVAVMPTLIVIVAVFGFGLQAGLDPADLLLPYAHAFAHLHWDGLGGSLLRLAVLAPVAVIPIAYCFVPDRRRRPFSAVAVVALPLYLALGNAVFSWNLPEWAPAVTLLACFAAWIAVARLRPKFRAAALLLLAVSGIASWTVPTVFADAAWRTALVQGL